MKASLHPLRLHTLSNSAISTIFHSFFFIETTGESGDLKSLSRIPQNKAQIENIEAGLTGYLSEIISNSLDTEKFGYFVITGTDGNIFNAFWRGYKTKIFIGVSDFFIPSFARNIFDDLGLQKYNTLYSTLLKLCELPLVSMCGFAYRYKIATTFSEISFSSIEHVQDIDLSEIILRLFTPYMLTIAWEALILEKKVLVVSSNTPLVAYSCEFLRRIVSPLTVVTFSSLLPKETLQAIEAPFPYLVGGCTDNIRENDIDLTETVVIDLDTRNVITPYTKDGALESYAPLKLRKLILERLNMIMMSPMASHIGRCSTHSSTRHNSYPSSTTSSAPHTSLIEPNTVLNHIILYFTKINLSLLTARACSGDDVPQFFRRTNAIPDCHLMYPEVIPLLSPPLGQRNSTSSIQQGTGEAHHTHPEPTSRGFITHGNYGSFACGMMQILKERYTNDKKISFETCWIEMDNVTFAVYDHVDDLPFVYFSLNDIRSVSPLPLEPEEHVFELILTYGRSYRFVATDPDSRKLWVLFIDKKLHDIGQGQGQGRGIRKSNQPSPKRRLSGIERFTTSVTTTVSSSSSSTSAAAALTIDMSEKNSPGIQQSGHLYGSGTGAMGNNSSGIAGMNSGISGSNHGSSAHGSGYGMYTGTDYNTANTNNIEVIKLGYSDSNTTNPYNPNNINDNTYITHEDEQAISQFRFNVNQTQMVNNLYAQFETEKYDIIFKSYMNMDGMMYIYAQEAFSSYNNNINNSTSSNMNSSSMYSHSNIEYYLPKNAMSNVYDFLTELIQTGPPPLPTTTVPPTHTTISGAGTGHTSKTVSFDESKGVASPLLHLSSALLGKHAKKAGQKVSMEAEPFPDLAHTPPKQPRGNSSPDPRSPHPSHCTLIAVTTDRHERELNLNDIDTAANPYQPLKAASTDQVDKAEEEDQLSSTIIRSRSLSALSLPRSKATSSATTSPRTPVLSARIESMLSEEPSEVMSDGGTDTSRGSLLKLTAREPNPRHLSSKSLNNITDREFSVFGHSDSVASLNSLSHDPFQLSPSASKGNRLSMKLVSKAFSGVVKGFYKKSEVCHMYTYVCSICHVIYMNACLTYALYKFSYVNVYIYIYILTLRIACDR